MLNGSIDGVTRHRIAGWAQESTTPETPVRLAISVDDRIVFRVAADRHRQDLELAGLGSGRHSFEVTVADGVLPLQECVVRIYREEDGVDLPGSPVQLGAAATFDQVARQGLSALLATPGTNVELQDRITYLAGETEQLLQRLSDHHSHRPASAAYRQHQGRWKPDASRPADPASYPPRALVIGSTIPARLRDSGANAIPSHMASLQRLGYEVAFIPADLCNDGAEGLRERGISTYGTPWIASVEEVLRRESGTFDLVYLHRYDVAARYAALVKQYMPKARLIFSVADLHHVRLLRQAQVENRPELTAHAKHVRSQELIAASSANAVVTHSTFEGELLQRYLPGIGVHTVPWAVPLRPTTRPVAQRHGLAFIGNYAEQASIDAAVSLVQDIMPLIRRHDPAITCVLVGSNMPERLHGLAQPGVEILDAAPSLDEIFGRVRITVAPLAYGAGVRGEVLNSLAAGVPCVCTAIAAEGLNFPAELRPLVTTDIPSFVEAVIKLHNVEGLNQQLGLAWLRYVASHLQEPRIDALLRQVASMPTGQALVQDEPSVTPAEAPPPAGKAVAAPAEATVPGALARPAPENAAPADAPSPDAAPPAPEKAARPARGAAAARLVAGEQAPPSTPKPEKSAKPARDAVPAEKRERRRATAKAEG